MINDLKTALEVDPYQVLLHTLIHAEFQVLVCDQCKGQVGCEVNSHDNPVFEQIVEEGATEMLVMAVEPETARLLIARVDVESDGEISTLAFETFHPHYERLKGRWDGLIREYYEPRIRHFFETTGDLPDVPRPDLKAIH